MEDLTLFLANNLGNLFTANNISKYLKSQKREIGTNVILEYLKQLTSVFLINKVKRQNLNGKKIFEINDKFYFSDIGIRNCIVETYKQNDINQVLENLVFTHLKAL